MQQGQRSFPPKLDRLHRAAPLLVLALLAAMGVAHLSRPAPEDAEPYHRRVRQKAEAVPYRIGPWVGSDAEAPQEAVELLQPNVMISRLYEHQTSGETVNFLLVHCKDARDMAGHYPLNCYPAHGWTLAEQRDVTWQLGDMRLPGRSYRFTYQQAGGDNQMIVNNFIIMPDGRIVRDISEVYAAAADYTSHFYGAAQVQLVMRPDLSAESRRDIFQRIVGANRDVIQALRNGIGHQDDDT